MFKIWMQSSCVKFVKLKFCFTYHLSIFISDTKRTSRDDFLCVCQKCVYFNFIISFSAFRFQLSTLFHKII